MKVIQGGYQEGAWHHEREAYSDEEIAVWNERLRLLMDRYPHLLINDGDDSLGRHHEIDDIWSDREREHLLEEERLRFEDGLSVV